MTRDELERYKRNICVADVGVEGQKKIRRARVLVAGAGGLGSPIVLYLASAGVGTIGVVDPDVAELSNLQRQIVYDMSSLGRPKVECAAKRIARLNPDVKVESRQVALAHGNVRELIDSYDVVVDALDNIETRLVLSDACVAAGKPFVHGAVMSWTGQAMTYIPGKGPCYRCVFGGAEADGGDQAGVLSPVPGVIGAIEATEALKIITGRGRPLLGRLLLWDAKSMDFDVMEVKPDPDCQACGGSQMMDTV